MISERLRQARLRAGLTQQEVVSRLSEAALNLTKAALSKYELGRSSPNATLLVNLARILGVRSDYFLKQPTVNVQWLSFRKQASFARRWQERIKARAMDIVEAQVWLYETLHPHDAPNFPKPSNAETAEDAESAAAELRRRWRLDDAPIESVTQVVEDHGGIVVEHSDPEKEFHGLSGWANKRYPVTVVNAASPPDRRRFSLAHELGHLVMACGDMQEKQREKLAQRFAAAFLVPQNMARRELGDRRRSLSFEELALLKQKHGLSMMGWMLRARDLSIVSDAHFRTLCARFSARGWRKKEPVEFAGRESPLRLRQMTLRALEEGIVTPEKAEELCPGYDREREERQRKHLWPYISAVEVMKLPQPERDRILAEAATLAEKDYREDGELTGFDAFGEGDLLDEPESR